MQAYKEQEQQRRRKKREGRSCYKKLKALINKTATMELQQTMYEYIAKGLNAKIRKICYLYLRTCK